MALIPFDDRDGFIWLGGEMVPWREAKTHTLCHGLHYASSVFEGEELPLRANQASGIYLPYGRNDGGFGW